MNINLGVTSSGKVIGLPLRLANRHGIVTGRTGAGKSKSLQRLAEQFSAAGVPVFAPDVKGDLSGIGSLGNIATRTRADALGQIWSPDKFPVEFYDLFGAHGLPIRTNVQSMGPLLLSTMLRLNETQAGALAIAFRISEKEQSYLLTLDDLRWTLSDMLDKREEVCREYGNITASSISAIQRNILALEAQGGDRLFGEPGFSVLDLIRLDADGRGIISLLYADQLMECPKLFATLLLWMLTELFRTLPEVGDTPKPKLVFMFDEAHLLFRDAPKELIQQIERLVRLVRSKGVGVFFVTQSPTDVPDSVLEQLGTRIMHSLVAHTQASLRKIKAAADTVRPNPGVVDARTELPALGNGEALVSVFGDDEIPAPVERVKIYAPTSQMGPISPEERRAAIDNSPLRKTYHTGQEPNVARHQFDRRMKEMRGIDPGPEREVLDAWQPGDYAKYLPFNDASPMASISAIGGAGIALRLFGSIMWLAASALLFGLAWSIWN